MTPPEWLVAWAGDEQAGVLEVSASGPAADAVGSHVPALVIDEVASRIGRQDATLWGADAEPEASIRLGWVDVFAASRPLVEEVLRLRDELAAEGVDRVVLCGMGGSSLAPEVVTRTAGVPLVVLDGTDPGQVRRAVTEDLQRTLVVVSSKSGSTVETDSQRRAFEVAFEAAGIDARRRIVVVTDPGSPLEEASLAAGYRAVFRADPSVGGRFSALTAFGVVPSGLAGADVAGLLDDAEAVADLLGEDAEGNPALVLAAAIAGTDPLRDKLVFVDEGSGVVGFADWAEQLIAESTGKLGTGLLPVVVEGPEAPEATAGAGDVLVVRLVGGHDEDPASVDAEVDAAAAEEGEQPLDDARLVSTAIDGGGAPSVSAEVTVAGPLGAQMLLWEYATAVAGRLLGINPFDQPDVESAKKAARGLLDARPEPAPADLVDGAVEVRGTPGLLDGVGDLPGAVAALLDRLGGDGYVAVMAYLDREVDDLLVVRAHLAARTGRPVTFGWGPRFLHSTGQYHKGGPRTGVYLQVTADAGSDLDVPGRPFTFGQLIAAQAAGDARVLADHGRPVLRLHLTEREVGLARLREILGVSPVRIARGQNPLRDERDKRLPRIAGPCGLVLFGVTGDLARKKLMPAVYDLSQRGLLPPGFALVGFARRDWADQDFGKVVYEAVREYARTPFRESVWHQLAEGFRFVPGEFSDDAAFDNLAQTVADLDRVRGTGGNHAFYLSIPPGMFPLVTKQLARSGLSAQDGEQWRRVVIEKPFGRDLATARELNDVVESVFPPDSVFRIDHYLGKETVQNLLAMRFANQLFEPIWNAHFVDHVQITMAEDIGIGGRAGYYDGIGAARDVIQNHLLQLLALTAMEEPVSFDAQDLRAEKEKALSAVRLPRDLAKHTARGQYAAGWQGGQQVKGYLEEDGIPADSRTETFAAIRLDIDTRRWAGVPFYLRTGKRLGRRVTEIAVVFKRAPHLPFERTATEELGQNALVIRVQPDEGVTIRFGSKVPGTAMEVRDVTMDFGYGHSFTESSPEAYERLILDVLLGDPPLFPRHEEVELSWRILDPITAFWASKGTPDTYHSGGWGPTSAAEMMARDGRVWRRP